MITKGRLVRSFGLRWTAVFLLFASFAIHAKAQQSLFDSFESYVFGDLDANGSGPNSGPGGGTNGWFGPFPPNLEVLTTENGVTAHGGTNMVRGANSFDLEYFNVAYRLNGSNAYSGDVILDWWFYDPIGTTNFGNYQEVIGIGYFDGIPLDSDYGASADTVPGNALQLFSLGASPDQDGAFDGMTYQAQILGATNGYDPGSGWFNTLTTRSIGWHHGRIQISPITTNSTTVGTFYIDDMATPTLTQETAFAAGYNAIEIKSRFGRAAGYFDEISFGAVAPPTIEISRVENNVVLSWPTGWTLQSSTNLSAPNFVDLPTTTSPYTNSIGSGNLFFRIRQ